MGEMKISFSWQDPLGAKGAELRATWAKLSICIDQAPVTRVFDIRSKTVREEVFLPLYPLAEWLVENWWALLYEPSRSSVSNAPGYDERHSLVHAREGYALPRIRIEPQGSTVRLAWSPEKLSSQRVEFTEAGEASIEVVALYGVLSDFIESVVGRLRDCDVQDSRLQKEWVAIQSSNPDEVEFCQAAGALGLDPYDLDDRRAEEIERIGSLLPEEIQADFFQSAQPEPESLMADAHEIEKLISRFLLDESELPSLKQLQVSAEQWRMADATAPWDQGYEFARELRTHLQLDGARLPDFASIYKALDTMQLSQPSAIARFSRPDIPFPALVGTNRMNSPVFAVRPAAERSMKFHFCRALFEALHLTDQRVSLVTDANTNQQKRNRAFAAEFLAPASALRSLIRTPIATSDQIEEAADSFGVSAFVVAHQLINHGIAEVERF